VLHDLIETLPQSERYTYDFEGNSQALDHILLSNALFAEQPFSYDTATRGSTSSRPATRSRSRSPAAPPRRSTASRRP